jgi:alpha/beta superfamily hydrolase
MSTPAPTITTFQMLSGDGWLFATLTSPTAQAARCAVLLCPPLVEERKAAQRAMVGGARYLAGHVPSVVLRIDYRGCGDSSGAFEDYTVGDWLADIEAASVWLTERFPDLPQVRLGVRAGALLALQPPAQPAPLAAYLFWEPVAGADFIRQLLQRRMVNDMVAYGRAQVSRKELETTLRTGGRVDLDGYTFTGSQFTQLEASVLPGTTLPLLALATGADTRALEALRSQAPAMASRTIRLAPFWNSVGHVETQALAEASAAWLQERFPAPPRPIAAPPALPLDPVDPAEAPLAILHGEETIRAVLHRPAAEPPAHAFLFLGGWSGDRQGPHRLFLDLARQLARQGNCCLRIDYRGRGESDGTAAAAGIATMIDDADAAVTWFKTTLPAGTPITLIAICSGCKVAIGAATRHPDVHRLVLWSAEVMGCLRAADTNLRKTLGALRTYGKKLARRETWGKLLAGQVHTGMVGKALAGHETRSAAEARGEDQMLAAFSRYRGRIRFIYGGSDPDAAPAALAYRRFCRRHGIDAVLDVIPHAGHSYYGFDWRNDLMDRTRAWLASSDESAPPVSRTSK